MALPVLVIRCNEITSIEKLPHSGGVATCTKRKVCTVCGESYGELDSDNHTETEVRNKITAGCTEDGYSGDTYCKECNKLIEQGCVDQKATGHTYKIEVTKEPTCSEEGIRTYTCDVCGDTYTEAIEKCPEEEIKDPETGEPEKESPEQASPSPEKPTPKPQKKPTEPSKPQPSQSETSTPQKNPQEPTAEVTTQKPAQQSIDQPENPKKPAQTEKSTTDNGDVEKGTAKNNTDENNTAEKNTVKSNADNAADADQSEEHVDITDNSVPMESVPEENKSNSSWIWFAGGVSVFAIAIGAIIFKNKRKNY